MFERELGRSKNSSAQEAGCWRSRDLMHPHGWDVSRVTTNSNVIPRLRFLTLFTPESAHVPFKLTRMLSSIRIKVISITELTGKLRHPPLSFITHSTMFALQSPHGRPTKSSGRSVPAFLRSLPPVR